MWKLRQCSREGRGEAVEDTVTQMHSAKPACIHNVLTQERNVQIALSYVTVHTPYEVHIHTLIYSQICAQSESHSYTPLHLHALSTHTHTHTHTKRTHTHAYTYTHIVTHIYKFLHTHTHTHTPIEILIYALTAFPLTLTLQEQKVHFVAVCYVG